MPRLKQNSKVIFHTYPTQTIPELYYVFIRKVFSGPFLNNYLGSAKRSLRRQYKLKFLKLEICENLPPNCQPFNPPGLHPTQ